MKQRVPIKKAALESQRRYRPVLNHLLFAGQDVKPVASRLKHILVAADSMWERSADPDGLVGFVSHVPMILGCLRPEQEGILFEEPLRIRHAFAAWACLGNSECLVHLMSDKHQRSEQRFFFFFFFFSAIGRR